MGEAVALVAAEVAVLVETAVLLASLVTGDFISSDFSNMERGSSSLVPRSVADGGSKGGALAPTS